MSALPGLHALGHALGHARTPSEQRAAVHSSGRTKSGILLALNTQGQAEDGLIACMRNHRLPQQCSPRHAAKFVYQNLLWNANETQ